MSDLCALCDDPMHPGAKRADTADGRKAHASCVQALATLTEPVDMFKMMETIENIAGAQVRQKAAELLPLVVDEQVTAAVKQATIEVILPTKSVQLRTLMESAADSLMARVNKGRSYGHDLELGDIAAMVKAATVLRTIAIYVSEEAS